MVTLVSLVISYILSIFGINYLFGTSGLWGDVFVNYSWIKFIFYTVIMSHLTISCMSLSFHRYHTHKGVILHPVVDTMMQLWLWLVTSMCKPDWVSVHIYHHAHSDGPKDPHSPVQKGFWRVFLLGVADYTHAKSNPEVLKIRKTIKLNKLEKFISENLFLGPAILSLFLLLAFGPVYGSILMLINFLISPLFAVGGVNALAHTWGYRNHFSGDNSRNIGFIFPLNWIICGELDHNNHHAHQRSCSFRHKWYEFDIGYFYIKFLSWIKLSRIYHAYTPDKLKLELAEQVRAILERDYRFKSRVDELAKEFNTNYSELCAELEDYVQGKKVRLDKRLKEIATELKHTARVNMVLRLKYA